MSQAPQLKPTVRTKRRSSAASKVNASLPLAFPARKSSQPTKRKTGKSTQIEIKAHQRTLHEHVYAGVCKNCDQAFERVSLGFRFPIYCGSCACLSPAQKLKHQPKVKLESKFNIN